MPYMADPRHHGDTLFLVCEEDFRIYPEKALERGILEADGSAEYMAASSAAAGGVDVWQLLEPAKGVQRGVHAGLKAGRYLASQKPKAQAKDSIPLELEDLVRADPPEINARSCASLLLVFLLPLFFL